MLAVKETDFRDQTTFADWISRVFNGETLIISDAQKPKAVMISVDEFNAMKKERERAEYLTKLDRAFADISSGKPGIRKTMEELEAMANE